mmetsp:Transcript_37846/g.92828  ORF Transcript_37846/g.92828 Transcript_37846/m.92828 type:complete len:107 (+) Transcript_37846:16-336(+)
MNHSVMLLIGVRGDDERHAAYHVPQPTQLVTHVKNNELVTDVVVREGGGYATTGERRAADDKRQRALEAAIDQVIATSVKPKVAAARGGANWSPTMSPASKCTLLG